MNLMIKSTYDWLLHFNPYTQMWNLFHKEDTVAYWNGDEFKHPHIKSHNLDTLKSILEETSGLEDKIIEYINKHV
jgi:hypothetical protein